MVDTGIDENVLRNIWEHLTFSSAAEKWAKDTILALTWIKEHWVNKVLPKRTKQRSEVNLKYVLYILTLQRFTAPFSQHLVKSLQTAIYRVVPYTAERESWEQKAWIHQSAIIGLQRQMPEAQITCSLCVRFCNRSWRRLSKIYIIIWVNVSLLFRVLCFYERYWSSQIFSQGISQSFCYMKSM